MGSVISAIHYCIPPHRLTNAELIERFGEKSVISISRMSGITERRVVDKETTALDLACFAAMQLLKERQVDRSSIDLIVFAGETPDYQTPANACVLHDRLELGDHCAAFDINLGCSAFPYALSVVHSMLQAGTAKKALLLIGDALTKTLHPMDRGLVPLHGDGAVACLVEACNDGVGNVGFLLGTEGKSHRHLMIPASGARIPRSEQTGRDYTDDAGIVRSLENMHMNGPAVFSFSMYRIPDMIRACLDKFKLSIEDVDYVLLHQANRKMVDQIYHTLKIPEQKRFYFMEQVGNCAAASSPMVLAEAWRTDVIKPGMRVLLAGFGVGLSWGVAILQWPDKMNAAVQAPVEYNRVDLTPYQHGYEGIATRLTD